MRAYRWPALSRSVASDKISRPVLRLAALPLALVAPAAEPADTVMLRPSTSSFNKVSILAFSPSLTSSGLSYLAIIRALYLEARLFARDLDGRDGVRVHGRHVVQPPLRCSIFCAAIKQTLISDRWLGVGCVRQGLLRPGDGRRDDLYGCTKIKVELSFVDVPFSRTAPKLPYD